MRDGGVAQLVERLLCKQEVVGSIPSASRVRVGWAALAGLRWLGWVGWRVARDWVAAGMLRWIGLRCAASSPLGGSWRAGLGGVVGPGSVRGGPGAWRLVFLDCESGSGAFLDAQDVSGGLSHAAGCGVGLGCWGIRIDGVWVV